MSRHFDGTNTKYLEATSAPFTLTYPFTLACWYRPTTIAIGSIMSIGGSTSADYVELGAHSNGTLFSDRYNSTSGVEGTGFSAGQVQVEGTWLHAGMVCSAANSAVVYANGAAGATNTDNVALVSSRFDRTNIGCATSAGARNQFAQGDVAYAGIWDIGLTGAEMASLAGGVHPKDIQPTHLVAFWRLTGTDSPELDTSTSGAHPLTVIGATAASDPTVNAPSGTSPVMTSSPAVTGSAVAGQTLTSSTGAWTNSPTGYTYQWKRGGVAISGATASTYVLVPGDVGASIKCTVTATNASGSGSADSNTVIPTAAPSAPVVTTAPAITGTPQTGQVLTCSTGVWGGSPTPTYTYQWKRDGVAISGATASTYTTVSADEGHALTCTVTASNGSGTASATSNSVAEGPVVVASTILVKISNSWAEKSVKTKVGGAWFG